MTEYLLLSTFIESGIGGGHWAPDPTIAERILRQGGVTNGILVDDIKAAANVFADLLAQKEFGELASASVVKLDYSDDCVAIFDMTPGTPNPAGGHYLEEEMRFVIRISDGTRA